jgi:adenosylcobinamide-GDP ribazoletransferase
MLENGNAEWIIGAFIISRSMQAILASSFPYARANGGTGASFVSNSGASHRLTAVIIGEVLVLAFCGVQSLSVIAFAAAWLFTVVFGKWSCRKIGGVTGDIIGALSEITETIILAVGAILG